MLVKLVKERKMALLSARYFTTAGMEDVDFLVPEDDFLTNFFAARTSFGRSIDETSKAKITGIDFI